MKYKNLVKKIAAYVCMATLVVGSMAGIGTVTATAEETQVSDDIILNGDANGASAMIGYEGSTGYKYQFATLKDAPADYKYMIITYSGSIANLRMEFAYVGTAGETAKVGPYWFNPEQNTKFTTVGTASMDVVDEATVVVDLEASGISLSEYNSVHIHNEVTEVKIGYARLSKTADVKPEVDVMPEEEETTTPSETVELEDIELTGVVGTYAPEGEGYAYLAGMDVNAPAGYAYLALAYSGDATAFKDFRIELTGMGTIGLGENPYNGAAVDIFGEAVPAPTEEEQYVIIDLAATGLDITKAITNIHLHQTAGNGSFEITDAVLMQYYIPEDQPVDPSTLEDLILNGDETGASSMIKKFKVPAASATGTQYKYLGFATLKEPTEDYRYLILTYTGDIGSIRFEFAEVGENGETAKVGPWWFNKEGQELFFVTADGSDIPLDGGTGTTIVIDLWKSGVVLGELNSIHMQSGYGDGEKKTEEINLQIGMARLSTKPDINPALDVMPAENPTTTEAPTTEAPTTVAPTTVAPTTAKQDTTTVAPTTKAPAKTTVKKPAKVTIKKVNAKKKSAKKVKISLKKVKGAVGYQIAIYKVKKNAKKNKKALVKKIVTKRKVTITSKKLKNKKKLFVRARAYVLKANGKKLYGKWSKIKKVKIKK